MSQNESESENENENPELVKTARDANGDPLVLVEVHGATQPLSQRGELFSGVTVETRGDGRLVIRDEYCVRVAVYATGAWQRFREMLDTPENRELIGKPR